MNSNDSNPSERISSLILKSLTSALTEEEEEEVKKWRQESVQHEQLFIRLQKEAYLQERYIAFQRTHYPDGWQQLQSRIVPRKKEFSFRQWMKYAAIVIFLIGAGFLARTLLKTNEPEMIPAQVAEIQPGSTKAILELSNGDKIILNQDSVQPLKVLKKWGITSHKKELVYQNTATVFKTEAEIHTLRVPRGGEYKLVLADGTTVWMNSGSVLHYPIRFEGKERRVRMEGEAYFEVTRNPEKPFIVESGDLQVLVTGTEFNVKAYPEEAALTTTLVNGGVNLSRGDQSLVLTPSYQAVFDRNSNNFTMNKVNTTLYTSWKDGLFEFIDMPLEEICRQLGRWYDVEFTFMDPSIRALSFTGAAKREKSIEFILNIISNTNAIHVEIQDKQIILNKK